MKSNFYIVFYSTIQKESIESLNKKAFPKAQKLYYANSFTKKVYCVYSQGKHNRGDEIYIESYSKNGYCGSYKNKNELFLTEEEAIAELKKQICQDRNAYQKRMKTKYDLDVNYEGNMIETEQDKDSYCFQNGNLVLPFKIALVAKYSFKDIADILNISCQEVCNQFNQMAKKSNYKLFN